MAVIEPVTLGYITTESYKLINPKEPLKAATEASYKTVTIEANKTEKEKIYSLVREQEFKRFYNLNDKIIVGHGLILKFI